MPENQHYEATRSNAANILIVVALYIGYSFFEISLAIDAAILLVIGLVILRWQSRAAAFSAFLFGLLSFVLLVKNANADWLRYLASGAVVWSGAMALFHSFKFHSSKDVESGL